MCLFYILERLLHSFQLVALHLQQLCVVLITVELVQSDLLASGHVNDSGILFLSSFEIFVVGNSALQTYTTSSSSSSSSMLSFDGPKR